MNGVSCSSTDMVNNTLSYTRVSQLTLWELLWICKGINEIRSQLMGSISHSNVLCHPLCQFPHLQNGNKNLSSSLTGMRCLQTKVSRHLQYAWRGSAKSVVVIVGINVSHPRKLTPFMLS